MTLSRRFVAFAGCFALTLASAAAQDVAKDFPSRSIKIVVPFPAGGPKSRMAGGIDDVAGVRLGLRCRSRALKAAAHVWDCRIARAPPSVVRRDAPGVSARSRDVYPSFPPGIRDRSSSAVLLSVVHRDAAPPRRDGRPAARRLVAACRDRHLGQPARGGPHRTCCGDRLVGRREMCVALIQARPRDSVCFRWSRRSPRSS